MGKKHNSGDTPNRRGRTERPSSGNTGSGFYQKFSTPRPGADRPGRGDAPRFGGANDRERSGGNPRFGDSNRDSGSAPRSNFGRSTGDRPGGFGGPKKFGTGTGGFGKPASGSFNRGGESNSGGGYKGRESNSGSRPYGNRQEGGSGRSFDRSAPRRDDDRRPGGYGGGTRNNEERPARPFEPKKTWNGQPYRREGDIAVPRGNPGERNRKFVKTDPNLKDKPTPAAPRESDFNREPRPAEELGPDRAIRLARPFDFRGRPDEFGEEKEQRPARRESSEERPRGNYNERREGGFGSSTGERRSFGNRSTGEQREGGFGASRAFGGPQERGYGNRPDSQGSSESRSARPYGERSDRPARPFGERAERPERTLRPDNRPGRDASTPNRADKMKRGDVAGQAPDYKNLKHYEQDKTRGNKRRREEEDTANGEVRLNRYIANAGICSRRDADALIAAGEIKVNGQVVTEMGYKVQPTDTVQYGKTNLNREKLVYVLLNKPKDFITTTDDPEGRRTVMELVKEASKERIFPVGRLDRNTTGLLLFTNDGEVAQKLSHPSHRNKKIYQVELSKPLTEEHLGQIAAGLELEDGKAEVDDVAVVAGNAHFVGIEIHIGRNRIVRRIFEHLGYEVVSLDRVQYAGLTKKDLPRGKWRFLNEKEVIRLKYFM
ncbi:pseudouridine synthase [Hymenobacter volaticus]|uniref:Pseudouridine synthase n=1 Tax=Hymenobacter volaticus TaxID=2932254 RepID=A0ABY4G6D9_9BACT|nr:pseudouridine synthase [Hymenobacter volaticus]UOQ66316.1 pseudouridine synthase [Hymenobacter volaticus]